MSFQPGFVLLLRTNFAAPFEQAPLDLLGLFYNNALASLVAELPTFTAFVNRRFA